MKHNKDKFLQYLSSNDLEVFNPAQVESFFETLDNTAYKFLNDLVKKGWLTKLKTGLFAAKPSLNKEEDYMPNWHKVAEGLAYPRKYYIGFYSALQIHDLITQPALREYVITEEQVSPKIQYIQRIPFEIICFKSTRFFGYKKTWINDYEKIYCSDLEKTIIDCLYQPQYAGGLEGIVKAIHKSREKIKTNVLVEYAIRFKVQAVLKRLGFVLEKLDLFPTERNILNQLITESYTKLDPSINLKGTFHRKWRIEDNVGLVDILQTIDT